ncbi:hypothetical protein CL658_05460 [bacterium]|nr:hypothetical protein [bacterium]
MAPDLSSICFSQVKQPNNKYQSGGAMTAQERYQQTRATRDLPPTPLLWAPDDFYALTQGDQVSRSDLNKGTSHGSVRDTNESAEIAEIAEMSFNWVFGEPT